MNKKSSRSLAVQRAVLTVLCVVLGVLLALMIGGTVYAEHLLSRLNYVDSAETMPTLSSDEIAAIENETDPVLPGFTAPEVESSDVDFGTGPQLEIGGGDIVNILLIGQDGDSKTGARSDTMILCTFNKQEDTITMTSFLRDLYVKIPGYKSNRINAAYSIGGIPLLNQTLSENFGVEIDGNVQVDFSRFEEIIDMLGGVTMDLTRAEANFINMHVPGSGLTEGEHLLTGYQALMYARNRNDVDGDFSRTNRQRKLLNVLIDEYKNKKLTEMLGLLNDILPMVTTDISKADLTAYAVTLFPMLATAQIRTQSIPVADGYYGARINGMAVLVPDMEKNIQALVDSLT